MRSKRRFGSTNAQKSPRFLQNGSLIGSQAVLQHSPWGILALRICRLTKIYMRTRLARALSVRCVS